MLRDIRARPRPADLSQAIAMHLFVCMDRQCREGRGHVHALRARGNKQSTQSGRCKQALRWLMSASKPVQTCVLPAGTARTAVFRRIRGGICAGVGRKPPMNQKMADATAQHMMMPCQLSATFCCSTAQADAAIAAQD